MCGKFSSPAVESETQEARLGGFDQSTDRYRDRYSFYSRKRVQLRERLNISATRGIQCSKHELSQRTFPQIS